MFIEGKLQDAFNGLTLTYDEYVNEVTKGQTVTKNILFHSGDQKELNKWVAGRTNVQKYPLIWHVKEPFVKPILADFVESPIRLILFTSTKQSYYNDTRAKINYEQILDPLSDKIEQLFFETKGIEYASTEITMKNEPNFGVDVDRSGASSDFNSKSTKGDQAITLDYLDAKVLDLKLRFFYTNC